MKALLIVLIFATLAFIFFVYQKERDIRKALAALVLFAMVGGFGVLGMIVRPMVIVFWVHTALVIASWLSLLWYIFKGKYFLAIHLSPLATLLFYLLSTFLFGSGGLDLA